MHVHGLVQERPNFIANALEFRLSSINPAIWKCHQQGGFCFVEGVLSLWVSEV